MAAYKAWVLVVMMEKGGQADLASDASVENTEAAEVDPLDDIAERLKMTA